MTSYRTPLSRARGHGAAKHGVTHWIAERVSSVALIPLVLWAIYAGLQMARSDYAGAVAWLQGSALNPVLLVLLIAVSFWQPPPAPAQPSPPANGPDRPHSPPVPPRSGSK